MIVSTTTYIGIGGRTRHRATCPTCGSVCTGWTAQDALANLAAHQAIPVPPASVLAQPLTHPIVSAYPDYFISGCGRAVAIRTDCGHGYRLTDSCPCCP